jgi:hypothetical protein
MTFPFLEINIFTKSHPTVMPDLIRHPELLENTGFRRLSPEFFPDNEAKIEQKKDNRK